MICALFCPHLQLSGPLSAARAGGSFSALPEWIKMETQVPEDILLSLGRTSRGLWKMSYSRAIQEIMPPSKLCKDFEVIVIYKSELVNWLIPSFPMWKQDGFAPPFPNLKFLHALRDLHHGIYWITAMIIPSRIQQQAQFRFFQGFFHSLTIVSGHCNSRPIFPPQCDEQSPVQGGVTSAGNQRENMHRKTSRQRLKATCPHLGKTKSLTKKSP